MVGAWKVLILLVLLAGVSCVRRRQPQLQLRYKDIVTQALKVFNNGQQGRPLFRLLEASPSSRLNSTRRVPLNFRIRETVCTSTPETQRQPENCAFREGGEERVCIGQFSKVRLRQSLTVSCDQDCESLNQGSRLEPESAEATEPEPAEVAEPEPAEVAEPEPAEVAETPEATVPSVIRNLYEKTKYDAITNILSNF
ncbi:cathelicidin antimicrobial peptide [Octodon degus]|uniref:Cathelicidin antimicrobial peptide n=1 Tax=Octodon degus TaxID=10160 RepID=A0A6P3FMS8_OCTDE|nr:cathelicidin antimicrobial peptide [Octodon degus]